MAIYYPHFALDNVRYIERRRIANTRRYQYVVHLYTRNMMDDVHKLLDRAHLFLYDGGESIGKQALDIEFVCYGSFGTQNIRFPNFRSTK